MNILQIVPQIPYPPDNGARIGIFNVTKHLALRGHNIVMFSLGTDRDTKQKELEEYCELYTVEKDTKTSFSGIVSNLFESTPYTILKYYSADVLRKLMNVSRVRKPDVVHVDHLHMAIYGKLLKQHCDVPIALREHNVEYVIWERFYKVQKNPFIKAYAYLQYEKVKQYERTMCGYYDRVFAITQDDEERLRRLNKSIKTTVIPAGVDTAYFASKQTIEEYSILFLGSLDWQANIDGLLWFIEKIFPLVLKQDLSVKLLIVGKNPVGKIMALRSSQIEVHPNVPDVREYIEKAKVFIVPLRIGGGMRLKILEAFAMQKAIVSTSVGCEGIEVENDKELMIADDEQSFAEQVISLLSDGGKRKRLGNQGYELVKRKYSWERVAKSFEAVYEELVGNSA
jgi:glycosyltransferase involved in cell wall biosynthesis